MALRSAQPDFDVRDVAGAAAEAAPDQRLSRDLVGRRTSTLEAFVRTAQSSAPGMRLVANRYGVPKMLLRDGGTLSPAFAGQPADAARAFLRSRAALFPFTPAEIAGLRLIMADSSGGATHVAFVQTVNGIDVFNGQIKITLNAAGEVVQAAAGDAAPGLTAPSAPSLSAEDAVLAAYRSLGEQPPSTLSRLEGDTLAFRNPRGDGYSPITAGLSVFPLNALTARLAYRIFLETGPDAWYEMLIDAEDGALLFRHNVWVNQSSGSARVWTQPPTPEGSRQLVNFPAGWIPASGTMTSGNNVDAFVDSNGDNQPDTTADPNLLTGHAYSAAGVFDFGFGDGLSGNDPRLYKPAAVANLFYLVNLAHDYYYNLGFTETAGNFQADNLGRGGTGNDSVLALAQHGTTTNNASFAPTLEGTAPRLKVGIFTRGTSAVTDDLDADYDGQVILHEYGHGVTTRMVGSGLTTSCLSRIQSGALGEGWSDYFGASYFNNPVTGAYLTQNFVRGIRRQSYQGYTYTYEDLGNTGYEVHSDGEIWAATLWDLRSVLGQAVTDRLVFGSLRATPCYPSMIDARDAILSLDQAANGGANRAALWTVFARHGMGYSAKGTDGTSSSGTRYDAAYDRPNDLQVSRNPAITSNPLSVAGAMGAQYSYTIAANNPNGGTLSYAVVDGPAGMTVNGATVTCIPGFIGQRVKIRVTDGSGGSVIHGYMMPVLTPLTSGVPLTISAARGTAGYAKIDLPAGNPVLQATLRAGSGDPDLYVFNPDGAVAISGREGGDETLTFANPKAGRWIVRVSAFDEYANITLEAKAFTPPVLNPNRTVSGLSGVVGSETLYSIPVPAGAPSLTVTTTGGTGDVDLFLRRGQPASCQAEGVTTGCFADKASLEMGNDETIVITNPAAGDWYVDLSAFDAYSGVTLAATIPILTITTAPSLPQGALGEQYRQTLAAKDGVSPYTWTLIAGALPSGLSLSPAGVISGTPAAAGSYTFSAKVTDSAGTGDTVQFTITITEGVLRTRFGIDPDGSGGIYGAGSAGPRSR